MQLHAGMVGKGMNIDLKDKVVLITGGAGCIGEETSRIFAQNGAAVYINDVNCEKGSLVAKEIADGGGRAVFCEGDVTSESDMKEFTGRALSENGRVDILVNNAGYNVVEAQRKDIGDYDVQEWDKVTGICLDGLFYCTRAILPVMRKQGYGKIVNIASVAGWRAPLRLQSIYSACKAAILNLTGTMAMDYGEYGINVNAVIPGSILSPFIKDTIWRDSDKMAVHVPLGHGGSPLDIANAVLFLCSDEAAYITGSELNVDGGWASGYAL